MSDELVRILPFSVDLSKPIENTELHELFVMGDSLAHRFELEITRGSEAVSLSGCTVTVCFTNFAEDTTVKWDGEVKNGKASVTLSDPCYTLHGQFVLTIQISGGGVDASVFCGDGFMRQTKTETIIYDDYVIYDVSTLLTQIGAMKAATEAANTATANANTATGKANTAAQTANTAASGANTARDNANTAAGAANTAAGKIDAMTVSATPVDTGTATAELTTVDGHYHLALCLPKGETGATPQISVEVQTGAAGSEASVSVSGTAENPVIHLTIPRGDTGNIGSLKINGKTPDASGTVTLGIDDISGLSDAIANAGGVKTVAGVSPDSAGNVALNAESVGALDASGTAADSSKLGGKAPEYYIQPRNLLDNSDFTNPVNQRGQAINDVGGIYWLDRWRTSANGNYEVKDTCISIKANQSIIAGVEQRLDNPTQYAGKTLTLAVFARAVSSDAKMRLCFPYVGEVTNVPLSSEFGIYTYTTVFQANDAGNRVAIFAEVGSEIEVKWAALYEGSYTADTLPPYVPKGYAQELAECRRYYKVIDVNVAPWLFEGDTMRRYYVGYEPMRIAPTVDVSGLKEYNVWTDLASTLYPYSIKTNRILMSANTQTTSTKLYIGGSIALSADL